MANEFIHQRHAEEGTKLHGIVMGAAASGIAFALHETADRPITWSLAVILTAVLAWSMSFAAGVINRRKIMQVLKSNLLRNEAQAKGDQVAYDIAVEYIDKHKRNAYIFQEVQLWTLLAGAVLYVSGHTWHLAEQRQAEVLAAHQPEISLPARPNHVSQTQSPPPLPESTPVGSGMTN